MCYGQLHVHVAVHVLQTSIHVCRQWCINIVHSVKRPKKEQYIYSWHCPFYALKCASIQKHCPLYTGRGMYDSVLFRGSFVAPLASLGATVKNCIVLLRLGIAK